MRKKRFVRPQALRSASQDRLEETQSKPSSLRGVRTSTWGCFYCGKIEVHQLNARSLARDPDRLQVHNSRLSRRVKISRCDANGAYLLARHAAASTSFDSRALPQTYVA